MFARTVQRVARPVAAPTCRRTVMTTLETNPHIYAFPDDRSINSHILSFLASSPPKPQLAVGTTTKIPPTPDSLTENHNFLNILQSVLAEHAHQDAYVISQAQAMASTAGSSLGSGGAFFPQPGGRRRRGTPYGGGGGTGGDGAGGASSQGGAGGAGRGGYIHVYDLRSPPDYGRIPAPEDIFGSLEVDGEGNFVDGHGRLSWLEFVPTRETYTAVEIGRSSITVK